MWSTVTAILFFSPQSLANLSNQVSYSGTKCAHCTIDSALSAAMARDTNGADSTGAAPTAASVRPVSFKNRRLVTRESPFVVMLRSPSGFGRMGCESSTASTGLLFIRTVS